MTLSKRPLDVLQASAVKALRRYLDPEEGRDTAELREVAHALVEAREHFYTRDGSPDWTGRTHAYRAWNRELMGLANVPPGEIASLQASIRYHSGAALRERLDAEQLEALGLRADTPRERSVAKRERISETLNLVTGGSAIEDAEEVLAALKLILSALRRIQGPVSGDSAEVLAEIGLRLDTLKGSK